MIWLLDTNACRGFLTGRSAGIRSRFAATRPQDVALCSVVKAELLFGARKSGRPAENLTTLTSFFAPLSSLPFDDRAAEHAGEVRALLKTAGTPIGPNDLLIAATALANGLTLVTHNLSEFARVPGLKLEDWDS